MLWTGEEGQEEGLVMYFGTWERDRMEGEGTMWWGDTGNLYSGHWLGGKMHGGGKIEFGLRSRRAGERCEGRARWAHWSLVWRYSSNFSLSERESLWNYRNQKIPSLRGKSLRLYSLK